MASAEPPQRRSRHRRRLVVQLRHLDPAAAQPRTCAAAQQQPRRTPDWEDGGGAAVESDGRGRAERAARRRRERAGGPGWPDRSSELVFDLPACRTMPRVPAAELAPNEFCARHVDLGRPVVLAGAADAWPAVRTWSVEHLAERVGDRMVEVALGVDESSGPTVKASVGLRDLALQIAESDAAESERNSRGVGSGSGGGGAGGSGGGMGVFRGPAYLKQTDLFRLAPSLRSEIDMGGLLGDRCLCSSTHYCWVGPRGAVTGLHNDDEDNLLAQLRGRKRVLLYEPEERPHLYINSKYDSGTECCDVDPVAPDYNIHPLLKNAKSPLAVTLEVTTRAILTTTQLPGIRLRGCLGVQPGDVLFVPKFWYHHVTSLSTTVSVNLFFSTPRDFMTHGLARTGKEVLHAVGLLGRGHCVCHPAALS